MPGTWSKLVTVTTGQLITAAERNNEFDNVITNDTPDGCDDASANNMAMQATADPYPASVESLATDLTGELKRLRFAVSDIKGTPTQWYYLSPQYKKLFRVRRPNLVYSSGSVINVETGLTGTASQGAMLWSDGEFRADSTAGDINCNLAQVAAFASGTVQSGLRTGTVSANTWYYLYAVKVTKSGETTKWVTVADTVAPTQGNYATLNSNLGTDGWRYLGCLPYGDGAAATTAVPVFVMSNGRVVLYNNMTGSVGSTLIGIRLATSAGATSLAWTYAAGTAIASGQIPGHLLIGNSEIAMTSSTTLLVTDTTSLVKYLDTAGISGIQVWLVQDVALTRGITISPSGSTALDISLISYVDPLLDGWTGML